MNESILTSATLGIRSGAWPNEARDDVSIPFFTPEGVKNAVRVLILGEMDFSLSCAIANLLSPRGYVLGTAYYARKDCPQSSIAEMNERCQALMDAKCHTAHKFGVDATQLHENESVRSWMGPNRSFSDIIFAFPRNVDCGSNMRKNAELIHKTFQSIVKSQLLDENGTVHLFIHVKNNRNKASDHYGIQQLNGWKCVHSTVVPSLQALGKILPQYVPRTCFGNMWKPQQIGIYSFRKMKGSYPVATLEKKESIGTINIEGVGMSKKVGAVIGANVQEFLREAINERRNEKRRTNSKNYKIVHKSLEIILDPSLTQLKAIDVQSQNSDMRRNKGDDEKTNLTSAPKPLKSSKKMPKCLNNKEVTIKMAGVGISKSVRAAIDGNIQQLLQNALKHGVKSRTKSKNYKIQYESLEIILDASLTHLKSIRVQSQNGIKTEGVVLSKSVHAAIDGNVQEFLRKALEHGVKSKTNSNNYKIRYESLEIILDASLTQLKAISVQSHDCNTGIRTKHIEMSKQTRAAVGDRLQQVLREALEKGSRNKPKHGQVRIRHGKFEMVFNSKLTILGSIRVIGGKQGKVSSQKVQKAQINAKSTQTKKKAQKGIPKNTKFGNIGIRTKTVQMSKKTLAAVGDRLQQVLQEALKKGSRSKPKDGQVKIRHGKFEMVFNSKLTILVYIRVIGGKKAKTSSKKREKAKINTKSSQTKKKAQKGISKSTKPGNSGIRTKSVQMSKQTRAVIGDRLQEVLQEALKKGTRSKPKHGQVRIRHGKFEMVFNAKLTILGSIRVIGGKST